LEEGSHADHARAWLGLKRSINNSNEQVAERDTKRFLRRGEPFSVSTLLSSISQSTHWQIYWGTFI